MVTEERLCWKILLFLQAVPLFPKKLGYELKDATMDMLGRAKSVKVQKENTIIVDGAGDSEAIKARVAQIRTQADETTSEFDKEKLTGKTC